ILQTDYYQFRAFFEPHNVRTDRLPGQSDTKKDGLARVYDAEATGPTYLFVRGNEATPDKDHPLSPGVPRALGGDAVVLSAVNLPADSYYPGLQDFVRREALATADARATAAQRALAEASAQLAAARKKLSDPAAAKANAGKDAATGAGAA